LHGRNDREGGKFKRAGVGRGQAHTLDDSIRTDCIRWLLPDSPAEFGYLAWMEQLRLGLNRRLLLGLFDYEAHFAVYEAGACYHKHLDAFQGGVNRILSTVFYLNTHWLPGDGGELLIHAPDARLGNVFLLPDNSAIMPKKMLETVTPDFGTMAIFLSAIFPHEVAVTHRKRCSIAGWFRGSNRT